MYKTYYIILCVYIKADNILLIRGVMADMPDGADIL